MKMIFEIRFRKFKNEQDVANFATLYQEDLISIAYNGNEWVVFYKIPVQG